MQTGKNLLGGKDVRSFKLTDLRRQIALVSQDTYLFNTSVSENLRLGRSDASRKDIELAAQQANAHNFIMMLPDKYDTKIGKRGMQLSGGQRQRIAIARAILKDAPILLLDEATSQLDAESEHLVHDALQRLMRGRTTLLIAHRLSTVRHADKIVVLGAGRVVGQGIHSELMAQNGAYRRLITLQNTAALPKTPGRKDSVSKND